MSKFNMQVAMEITEHIPAPQRVNTFYFENSQSISSSTSGQNRN